MPFELLDIELELVLDEALDGNGSGARQGDQGRVAHEAGLGDEHFVAGGADCPERRVDAFGGADGDDDFACGVVMHADKRIQILRDCLAQLHETCICRVLGLALKNAVYARLAERSGGDEVGLADAEGDAILSGRGDFKKFAYARGLHVACNRVELFCVIDHNFHLISTLMKF